MSDVWTIVHTERAASISDLEQRIAEDARSMFTMLSRGHALKALSAGRVSRGAL